MNSSYNFKEEIIHKEIKIYGRNKRNIGDENSNYLTKLKCVRTCASVQQLDYRICRQNYGDNLKSFGSLEYQKQHLHNKDYDE
jgi:hypothetical protein